MPRPKLTATEKKLRKLAAVCLLSHGKEREEAELKFSRLKEKYIASKKKMWAYPYRYRS